MRDEEIFLLTFWGILLVALLIGFIIGILFLMTLHRCLSRIDPRNRTMEPGLVWLNLIPCFGLIWLFFTVLKIGESLRAEYRSRRWPSGGDSFGVSIGIAYAALSVAASIPYLGMLFGIPAFICFVIYWVQIAGFSSRLGSEPPSDRFDDGFDDDFRRRPSERYEYEDDR